SQTQLMSTMTPAEKQDFLQKNKPDFAKPGAAKALISYNKIQKVAAQQSLVMKNDPGLYAQTSPLYKSAFERFQNTHNYDAFYSDILSIQSSLGILPQN